MMKSSFEAPAAIPIAKEPERMEHLVQCNKLLEEVWGCCVRAFCFCLCVFITAYKIVDASLGQATGILLLTVT